MALKSKKSFRRRFVFYRLKVFVFQLFKKLCVLYVYVLN